jgi:hypothetical protein
MKRSQPRTTTKPYRWNGKKLNQMLDEYKDEAAFIRGSLPERSPELAALNHVEGIIDVMMTASAVLGFCPQEQFRNFNIKATATIHKKSKKAAKKR